LKSQNKTPIFFNVFEFSLSIALWEHLMRYGLYVDEF